MAKKATSKQKKAALGFFYVASDDLHAQAIVKSIEDKGDFSDSILTSRVTVEKIDLVLVFVVGEENERVRYAAIATNYRAGAATGKQGVRLSDLVPLDLQLDALRVSLAADVFGEMEHLLAFDAERPSPEVWDAVWATLKRLVTSDVRAALEELEKRRRSPAFDFDDPSADKFYCQKDAVSVALDVAGIKRNSVFVNLSDGLAGGKTLLESASGSLKERVVISRDVGHIPNFIRERDQGDNFRFSQGNRVLTVYNVDLCPGEIALGCDLIYHNHNFNSFTFVQYKLMDDENGISTYRPDKQCLDEVIRMKEFLSYLDQKPRDKTKLEHFRLVPNPFFFKLCRRERLLMDMPELTRGMYLNLDFWDRLCGDARSKGPQGGTRITFDAADRWLCRTEFAPLVAEGWVGTFDISEDELIAYIEIAAQNRRNIIYARSSGSRKTRRA